MANLQAVRREKVILNLDKERELKFTLSAFADMEERYGSIDKAMEAVKEDGMRGMRFLLYVGLKHEDNTLTEESVGNLIDVRDMSLISEAITKCFGKEQVSNMGIEGGDNPNA